MIHSRTYRKTIKPSGVGGLAGGYKYIVQGILFKVLIGNSFSSIHLLTNALQFCRDPMVKKDPPAWLYGGQHPSDENAMKAARHELHGLALLADPGLASSVRYPLMAQVRQAPSNSSDDS